MAGGLDPVGELRAFFRAALVEPVPRDHSEPDWAFRRRRTVAVVTLVLGAAVLAWALRIEPGNDLFYVATIALAAVWAVGALVSGPKFAILPAAVCAWLLKADGVEKRPVTGLPIDPVANLMPGAQPCDCVWGRPGPGGRVAPSR